MSPRALLGWGPIATGIADSSGAPTYAVVESDAHVELALEYGYRIERGDPTDPAVLAELPSPVDSVLVADPDPQRALAMARAAAEIHPDAPIVAYASRFDTDATRALEEVATDVIRVQHAVADWIDQRLLDDEGHKAALLRRVIAGIDGELAVVTHDNPDPDALASAVALVDIAREIGQTANVYYFGNINHQENRAMVNLLDLDLRQLESPEPVENAGGVALVDHGRPGVNDGLNESTTVDIVIDHHPPRGVIEGTFVDLRSDVGATSTLIASYFDRLDIDLRPNTATALLYGIYVDTDDFSRGVTPADFNAASLLLPDVQWDLLEQIESPTISSDTFETISRAIHNRTRHGAVLTSCVGQLADRDDLAQAADRLLNLEGITTTLVFGIHDGTVYCSGRARGSDIDLGETLRRAFDHIGSAGGHDNMAGAQIPVGMLVSPDESNPEQIIAEVITNEFLETLERLTPLGVDQFVPDSPGDRFPTPSSRLEDTR